MREIAYLRNNKFICEETKGRKRTVSNQRDWGKGVDNSVNISKSHQGLQPSIVSIPQGTMPAKKNLNWTQCPPKHLIETIWKIDRSRTLKCWARWHAIDGNPTTSMHLKPSQDIFCHRTIDPSNLIKPENVQLISKQATHQCSSHFFIPENRN